MLDFAAPTVAVPQRYMRLHPPGVGEVETQLDPRPGKLTGYSGFRYRGSPGVKIASDDLESTSLVPYIPISLLFLIAFGTPIHDLDRKKDLCVHSTDQDRHRQGVSGYLSSLNVQSPRVRLVKSWIPPKIRQLSLSATVVRRNS
jgi:hypothetical protein